MRPNYGRRLAYNHAPLWVERTAPLRLLTRNMPSLLLVNMPEEDCYVVATVEESNAIADPNSFLGRLLRSHCALLSLPHVSNN
jgi:hypothetical protein